jgi:hypothetical protein
VLAVIAIALTVFLANTARLAATSCAGSAPGGGAGAIAAGGSGVAAALAAAGQAAQHLGADDYKPDRETAAAAVRVLAELGGQRVTAAGGSDQQAVVAMALKLAQGVVDRAGGMDAARKLAGLSAAGGGASSPRRGSAGRGAGPGAADGDGAFTQQTCYLNSDESEVCVFDNLLCFDGRSPIVTVEQPIRDPERIIDYTHSCE